MDRYTALQVFRHVAQLQSFAEAGRRLGLSPAAVSKNMAELEAHVGARLIHRTTRRMSLTEEGKTYLEHVARGLDALAEADQSLGPVKTGPSGTLRVSAPMTVTLTRLSTRIPHFLSRYPELALDEAFGDAPAERPNRPLNPAEAERRFFARYGDQVGGTNWSAVQRYLGRRDRKPATIEEWIAAAESVREHQDGRPSAMAA